MATLPDLPTSRVGVVAYYNLSDNGSISYDLQNLTELGSVGSYQQYDNGVIGTYEIDFSLRSSRFLNFRAKTDGWVVVWIDDEESFYGFADANNSYNRNIIDFFGDWPGDGINSLGNYHCIDVVGDLATAADSSLNFSNEDVSIYSYSYPDSTNIVTFGSSDAGGDKTFSYTSTIDRKFEVLCGGKEDNFQDDIFFQGQKVVGTDGANIASVNLLNGLTPDSGVNYTVNVDVNSSTTDLNWSVIAFYQG